MWSATGGCHVLDRAAAELLTGHPDLADTELPLDVVLQRVHPEDRAMILATAARAEHESGPIVLEYRVRTPDGTRWVLDHGRSYPRTEGMPAHGHGVLIDITEQKLIGNEVGESRDGPETPLERAARHALKAREAIDADGSASLRLLIDMVLLAVGRALARKVREGQRQELN
ncbi:PAS domain-containing protein [Methylobacterium sp. CCH5-D2]|uniref:PAS domain-containing protein n=1 Tax=Methylobacterium sp. CCH5-D2 TaxID=1768765 RepID=UPI0008338735|nr:PAS domain-containing protein [Methylobacterium sp. CCH5-D2]